VVWLSKALKPLKFSKNMQILNCGNYEKAIPALDQGKVIIYPTETVYGLGCRLIDSSVQRIFEIKQRENKPMSIALSSVEQIHSYAKLKYPELLKSLLPGPFTFILPKLPSVPDTVTAGLDTVGIRVPDHPVALALAKGGPIITTSANLSGQPAAYDFKQIHIQADIGIDCGLTTFHEPSTIINLSGDKPTIIRRGAQCSLAEKKLKNLEKLEK
jgi:L-threonylcarbamoyladenylate synthase